MNHTKTYLIGDPVQRTKLRKLGRIIGTVALICACFAASFFVGAICSA